MTVPTREKMYVRLEPDKSLSPYRQPAFQERVEEWGFVPMPQVVSALGDDACSHQKVFYEDRGFPAGPSRGVQVWSCDECPRREEMEYSPGYKIRFPPGALVSSPNPDHGGMEFYAWRIGSDGTVEEVFPEGERVPRHPRD